MGPGIDCIEIGVESDGKIPGPRPNKVFIRASRVGDAVVVDSTRLKRRNRI